MLNKADLREVSFADLQALKDNQIPESHTLDYKRDFPFEKEGRLSLAADVVAFANTRGGDLILGAEEQGGCIVQFTPARLDDRDGALLTLQSALTDLIEPKIPGVHLQAVEAPDGGYVIIVRTPPSFQAPHRVRKAGVFYTRTSTGIDPMDITTLRSAFLRSETAIEKVRKFREDRVKNLHQRPLPASEPALGRYATGVLHVVPLASVLGGLNFAVPELHAAAQTLPPPAHPDGYAPRINLDGVMSISRSREQTHSYTQLFRDGAIESVVPVQWEDGGSPSVAWLEILENALLDEHHQALVRALVKLGIEGPTVVMLSFVDIGDQPLESERSRTTGRIATVPSYYQNLLLPEIVVESFVTSSADIYGPLFDMVWNAAGRAKRPAA